MTPPVADGGRDREEADRDRSHAGTPHQDEDASDASGLYVYGIIPADVDVAEGAHGVGEPGSVTVIRHGDIAALVSVTDASHPPGDRAAHERLLNAAAAEVPVLPIRSGTVAQDAEAIVADLLEPHHDEFARALGALEGRAEYVVEVHYTGQATLREADIETLVEAVTPVSVLLAPAAPARERGMARLAILMDTGRAGGSGRPRLR
jgi:hypothetical protein